MDCVRIILRYQAQLVGVDGMRGAERLGKEGVSEVPARGIQAEPSAPGVLSEEKFKETGAATAPVSLLR